MPSQTHLLNRAFRLIDNYQMDDAELVLDSIVTNDPQNMDAWRAFIGLYTNCEDLEWIKERIILTREIRAADKSELLIYHDTVLRQLQEKATPYARMWVNAVDDYEDPKDPEETRIIFELLEEFNYPDSRMQPVAELVSAEVKKAGYSFPAFGVGLLAIFFITIRFLVLGYFAGYPLLILLLFGFAQWLEESSRGR